MTLLAIKLFFSNTLGRAMSWITASTTHLLLAGLAVALVWGAYERHGWTKAAKVLASTETAYRANLAASEAAKAKAEETSQHDAEINNAVHEQRAVAFAGAGDSYKQSHRLQDRPACPASGGQDNRAPLPAITASPAIVVADEDFDICTANANYALSSYEWAQKLIADGLAVAGD